MIDFARRFVSEFAYQLDATFNTNRERLPLEVLVGIDNTNHTFPFGLIFEISEATDIFRFINDTLTELIFYNVYGPRVQIGDFAAGLTKATVEFNEVEAAAAEEEDREPQLCKLQKCSWHAEEAILAHLVKSKRYSHEKCKELKSYLWEWVLAPTFELLDVNRGKLLAQLLAVDVKYFEDTYLDREDEFCKAYTAKYPNLGCGSTQRNEGFHPQI